MGLGDKVTRAVVAALLMAGTVFMSSAAGAASPCEGAAFENSYFLLQPEDSHKAYRFFLSLPNQNTSADGGLKNLAGERLRRETYYDDRFRSLLGNGLELSHSVVPGLPAYEESRESVSLVDHAFSPPKQLKYDVRRYNRKATVLDRHPLFAGVKRSQRQGLITYLDARGGIGDVGELHAGLTVEHREFIRLYRYFGVAYGAISLDGIQIQSYGLGNVFTALKFELFRDKVDALNPRELADLSKLLCVSQRSFARQYPDLQALPWLGYGTYNTLAEQVLPHRAVFDRYPLLYKLGQVFTLVLVGFLVLSLVLGRYAPPNSHRHLRRRSK